MAAITIAVFAALNPRAQPEPGEAARRLTRSHYVVSAALFLFFLLLYFPVFLARYGPYGEDKYFLSTLLRIEAGQQPYAGFEFIYGPLLLQPLSAWTGLFGYSLHSYYWLLAIVEALTFAALALVLARLIPERRRWLAVLLLALILLINDNLGISWIALRRLLPIVTLAVYAWRGQMRGGWLPTGALLGLQLVMSLEYAIAAFLAVGGAAFAEALLRRRPAALLAGVLAVVTGLAAGAVLALVLLGGLTDDWLRATWRIITLRGGGEAGFPFQLSVNAVAVLALLLLACAWLGAGVRRAWAGDLATGDRLLLVSVPYAIVAMKSGLARSDMYHLVPPVLGILAAALMPLPFAVLAPGRTMRRLAVVLAVLIGITYAPGLLGYGRLWGQGFVYGARDVLGGRPANGQQPARQRFPVIGPERTEVNPAWLPLAEFLAGESHAQRPVLYYESAWGLDRHIGVPKPAGAYATDDYLVSDATGDELRQYLEATPSALVVADTASWAFLGDSTRVPPFVHAFWIGRRHSGLTRVLELWSSSHYGVAIVGENDRKRDRWARTVGRWLRERYEPIETFGRYHVLARRNAM